MSSTTSSKSGTPLRTKRGLSYVLGDNNDHGNHILPISSIQHSSLSRSLYTAGRDGTIKVWKNDQTESSRTHGHTDSIEEDDYQDIDEKLLKLETSISSNPIPYSPNVPDSGTYSIVDNYKIHFDWINDLKLVNNDSSLVSCSSDLSIKLVDLNQTSSTEHCINHDNSSIHKFPNYHTDYIKKLSYNKNHNQIISGGLDESIIIWDLSTLKPTRQLSNRVSSTTTSSRSTSSASIYSLANNNGNIISAGGSNNSINLFDKRAQNTFIRKLIGHQDNIRCLLMNDTHILSGSSDTSIKLWDLRNFKVYKNFDIHDYPVWSLTNEGNDFSVFYSGDKGGNLVKTDLKFLSANSQFQPEIFPEFETFTSSDHAVLDEKLGISTIVAQGESPILSICHEEDTIFSSNYTSLNRHYVPDLHQISKYQYLRSCLDYSINREIQLNDEYASGLLSNGAADATTTNANPNEDLSSDFYDIVSHLSVDTNAHDIQSTFSHTPQNLFGETDHTNDSDYDDDDEYYSMFLDVNGGASREFVNMYKSDEIDENQKKALDQTSIFSGGLATREHPKTIDTTPVEILLNAISQSQITRIPYNTQPITEWKIVPKSIISKRLLNNKRQMLVLYLNGDITIWDILTCREIKSFPFQKANDQPLLGEVMEKRLKEMDAIYQDFQSNDTLNNWCDVEIKAGKLLVSIKETSFMNVEIYYDELTKNYPYTSLDHPDNAQTKKVPKIKAAKDDRFYVGTILLNSLFQQYTRFEWDFDNKVREELRVLTKNGKTLGGTDDATSSNGNGVDSNSVTSNLKRLKYFGKKSSKSNLSVSSNANSTQNSPAVSTATSLNDFSIESNPVKEFVKFKEEQLKSGECSDYDNSIMKLLQSNKKVYWEKYHYPTYSHSKGKIIDTLLRADQMDPTLEGGNGIATTEDEFQYIPMFQASRFPSDLLITIFEYSPDLGNYRDLCSFQFEDLKLNKDSNEELVKNLRYQLPRWIGLSILYNKWPEKESPKIAFQLLECDYPTLPADKKIGGKSQRKIKKLPGLESSIKLTSHNMLRVGKILYYLSEKFESKTSEMKDKKLSPPDWLVVDCKGQELSNDMTLQTIKTKIWKNSSDIELRFRRKFDT